jgi:hypothetical protein
MFEPAPLLLWIEAEIIYLPSAGGNHTVGWDKVFWIDATEIAHSKRTIF